MFGAQGTPEQIKKAEEMMTDAQKKQSSDREDAQKNLDKDKTKNEEEFFVGNNYSKEHWLEIFGEFEKDYIEQVFNTIVMKDENNGYLMRAGSIDRNNIKEIKEDQGKLCGGAVVIELAKLLGYRDDQLAIYTGVEPGHNANILTYLLGKGEIGLSELQKMGFDSKQSEVVHKINFSGGKNIKIVFSAKVSPHDLASELEYLKGIDLLGINSGEKVLFVEDNKYVDDFKIMKRTGCLIKRCEDLETALLFMAEEKFDKIITDGHFRIFREKQGSLIRNQKSIYYDISRGVEGDEIKNEIANSYYLHPNDFDDLLDKFSKIDPKTITKNAKYRLDEIFE